MGKERIVRAECQCTDDIGIERAKELLGTETPDDLKIRKKDNSAMLRDLLSSAKKKIREELPVATEEDRETLKKYSKINVEELHEKLKSQTKEIPSIVIAGIITIMIGVAFSINGIIEFTREAPKKPKITEIIDSNRDIAEDVIVNDGKDSEEEKVVLEPLKN